MNINYAIRHCTSEITHSPGAFLFLGESFDVDVAASRQCMSACVRTRTCVRVCVRAVAPSPKCLFVKYTARKFCIQERGRGSARK